MTAPIDAKAMLAKELLETQPVNRGSWQSRAVSMPTHEIDDVCLAWHVNPDPTTWQAQCGADDWAEQHFQERISGQPLNPAPSYIDWPWHSERYREEFKQRPREIVTKPAGYNADLQSFGRTVVGVREQPFDHTYPERIWPRFAHDDRDRPDPWMHPMRGIRFDYGDLNDVIALLKRDPFTRQAFLPIWFPEDTGSTAGQRVPCTIGYHFIRRGTMLEVKYLIRSCDITRHFSNDVYMAGRLLQHVVESLPAGSDLGEPYLGRVTMFISNLHLFTNDAWRYSK